MGNWMSGNFMDNYTIEDSIGKGTYGELFTVIRNSDGKRFALKRVNKKNLNSEGKDQIKGECNLMANLNHPNILKVHQSGEDEDYYYCVMDYYPVGDLFDLVPENGLSEEKAFHVFNQLINALHYLHFEKNIVHRDIKLENLLVSNENSLDIVLADFGFAFYQRQLSFIREFVGSPRYMAPEIFLDESYNGRTVDIWAAGVLFYVLLSGRYPFGNRRMNLENEEEMSKLKEAVVNVKFSTKGLEISKECINLFYSIFEKDPIKRFTTHDIRKDPCYVKMLTKFKK